MNRWLIALVIFTVINLIGCANGVIEPSGEEPPKAFIEIGNETYETTIGSYCWENTCTDTAGPVELLEGKEPIRVNPGERISFVMDYEPKPNQISVIQINNSKESNVVMKGNRITAPMQKGVYYYSYGVWWMDEKESNLSYGDAFYALTLEVK